MLQTDKSSVGDKKRKSHKKHGQFLFFHHLIMAGNTIWVLEESLGFPKSNTTWILKESPGFSKDILGLFHVNSFIKGDS